MQRAMETMKNTCSHDVDAKWLLHILRCVRQMYASLIHLDLPSEALDIFGSFILNLRYILKLYNLRVQLNSSLYNFICLFFIYYRIQCLIALFKQGADNIIALNREETWQIEYLNEDGGVTKLVKLKVSVFIRNLFYIPVIYRHVWFCAMNSRTCLRK